MKVAVAVFEIMEDVGQLGRGGHCSNRVLSEAADEDDAESGAHESEGLGGCFAKAIKYTAVEVAGKYLEPRARVISFRQMQARDTSLPG